MKRLPLPLLLALMLPLDAPCAADKAASTPTAQVSAFCRQLAHKLRTVTYPGCMALGLSPGKGRSVKGTPLFVRHLPAHGEEKGRILFIGGIHGDEWAAVSLTYLWLRALLRTHGTSGLSWLFVPTANPDGLFHRPSHRTNAHGVDLNRNFPSPDWNALAHKWWTQYKRRNPRYYPGPSPASEPETRFIVQLIHSFRPDVIISLHAPYNLLDYDGPEHAVPHRLGHLKLRQLGTYPGSLGRYAGEYLHIPVLTIELKSAARMPSRQEVQRMLADLKKWVYAHATSSIRHNHPH